MTDSPTNLRCIKHPAYRGITYTQDGCHICVRIYTQVVLARREQAIQAGTGVSV